MTGATVVAFGISIHANVVAELGSLVGWEIVALLVTVLHYHVALLLAAIALIVENLVTRQRATPARAGTAVRTVFVAGALLFAQGLVNFTLHDAIGVALLAL